MSKSLNIIKHIKKFMGVGELHKEEIGDKDKIDLIIKDSTIQTCVNYLVSLINQDMKITGTPEIITILTKLNNEHINIVSTLDSIIYNIIVYGYSAIYFDPVNKKMSVYDSETIDIVHDPQNDVMEGLYQDISYVDPESLKKGFKSTKYYRSFIKPDNIYIFKGIGRGYGESVILPAYEYVKAKTELVTSLPDLVKRLGLLTVISIDVPADLSSSDLQNYLQELGDVVSEQKANTTWILPSNTRVDGVKGSGESKIVQSVNEILFSLSEEIRKIVFIPDTFLTSVNSNRATAKEQRFITSILVEHYRNLIVETLKKLYDIYLKYERVDGEYDIVFKTVNVPEPETFYTVLNQLYELGVVDANELRSFYHLKSKENIDINIINKEDV